MSCHIGDTAELLNDVAEFLRCYYPLLQQTAHVF